MVKGSSSWGTQQGAAEASGFSLLYRGSTCKEGVGRRGCETCLRDLSFPDFTHPEPQDLQVVPLACPGYPDVLPGRHSGIGVNRVRTRVGQPALPNHHGQRIANPHHVVLRVGAPDVAAVPRAEVGLVALWLVDPLPLQILAEVDVQGAEATALFCAPGWGEMGKVPI